MITIKLTAQEKQEITDIPLVIDKQKAYQKPVPKLLSTYKSLVCNWFTRAGKLYAGYETILAVRKKRHEKIIVVVPSDVIKTQWLNITKDVPNIEIYIINTYVKLDKTLKDCILLVIDELHRVCGESVHFSQTIPSTKYEYFLGLSATLPREMLKKLEDYGVQANYEIPLELGYKMGVVPEYISYNLPVELTDWEKENYVKWHSVIVDCTNFFEPFAKNGTFAVISGCLQPKSKKFRWQGELINSENLLARVSVVVGFDSGVIVGKAKKYQYAVMQRSQILYNAYNKKEVFLKLNDYLPKEKKLIFTAKQTSANSLAKLVPLSKAFHSGITDKRKKLAELDFKEGKTLNLFTCKSISEGFTTDAKWAVRMFIDSKVISSDQIKGRLLIKNDEFPDEVARIITIYVEDFVYSNKIFLSQEKKWLEKSQKGKMFCKWIKNLNEIEF